MEFLSYRKEEGVSNFGGGGESWLTSQRRGDSWTFLEEKKGGERVFLNLKKKKRLRGKPAPVNKGEKGSKAWMRKGKKGEQPKALRRFGQSAGDEKKRGGEKKFVEKSTERGGVS